jgi:hypothetical protein
MSSTTFVAVGSVRRRIARDKYPNEDATVEYDVVANRGKGLSENLKVR